MKLRRLSTRAAGFDAELDALTRYEAAQEGGVEAAVRSIIADVRARGDVAVLEYARRFDKVSASSLSELEVPKERLSQAASTVSQPQLEALLWPTSASAPSTKGNCRSPGTTPSPTAPVSASASRRSSAWACTCQGARRRTRRRC